MHTAFYRFGEMAINSVNSPTSSANSGVKTGLVIDSTSQIPPVLAAKLGVEVVPITVTIDGTEYREGIDLSADAFYEMVSDPLPEISTSQPSPGELLDSFRTCVANGAGQILCVTMDAEHSGTYNSARLAAGMFEDGAPDGTTIRLVDSKTISFGVTASLWQAARALEAGATLEQAAQQAEQLAPKITSTFILASLDQVRKMGRVDFDALDRQAATAAPPSNRARTTSDVSTESDTDGPGPREAAETAVYRTRGGDFDTVGSASSLTDVCHLMAAQIPTDIEVRVGICLAAPDTLPYTEALEAAVARMPNVIETVRYRVGPSIAAHTGPGTAGLFHWPAT